MKRSLVLAAFLTLAMAGPAFAHSCPSHMKRIDAALATNPQLTEAQMTEVKALRAQGETLHKAGEHDQSLATLAKAERILGIIK